MNGWMDGKEEPHLVSMNEWMNGWIIRWENRTTFTVCE